MCVRPQSIECGTDLESPSVSRLRGEMAVRMQFQRFPLPPLPKKYRSIRRFQLQKHTLQQPQDTNYFTITPPHRQSKLPSPSLSRRSTALQRQHVSSLPSSRMRHAALPLPVHASKSSNSNKPRGVAQSSALPCPALPSANAEMAWLPQPWGVASGASASAPELPPRGRAGTTLEVGRAWRRRADTSMYVGTVHTGGGGSCMWGSGSGCVADFVFWAFGMGLLRGAGALVVVMRRIGNGSGSVRR